MMKNLIYFLFIVFPTMVWGQTLDVANVSSSQELIDQLLGEGVEISNFTVHGDLRQTGTFNDPIGILGVRNGLVMGTGDVSYAEPPNRPFNSGIVNEINVSTTYNSNVQSTLLDNISSGDPYFDAIIIEFDIIPKGNLLSFNYVLASEEYIEHDDEFPDFFGFWFSGPGIIGNQNLAKLPGTNIDVNTSTVNDTKNNKYYNDNGAGNTPAVNMLFGYDGYTDLFKVRYETGWAVG